MINKVGLCVMQKLENNISCINEMKKPAVLYTVKCEGKKKQEKINFDDFPLINTYLL